MGRQLIFSSKIGDLHALASPKEEAGAVRIEYDPIFGEREYRYVCNQSGGALNVDSLVAWDGPITAAVANTGVGTTYATRAANSWIADGVKRGDIVYVVDDAGAAGAAPEGEYSIITRVQALRIDFLPALSVALANGDTVAVIRRSDIVAAAPAMGRAAIAGIVHTTIPDDQWGWIITKGRCIANITAAGTAFAEFERLKAGAGILEPIPVVAINAAGDATDANEQEVAVCLQVVQTDQVRRKALVQLL